MYVCMYVCIDTHVYTYMYIICIYLNIYIYTLLTLLFASFPLPSGLLLPKVTDKTAAVHGRLVLQGV